MKKLIFVVSTLISLSTLAQKNTLLEQSFWKNAPDVNAVKAEIEKGSDPAQFNGASFDPVVLAINSGAPNETIKYLVNQPGNSVTKITHDARTYLHWAANRGNVEIVEFLVSKGAKADIVDSHGSTVLNFAAGGGQENTKIYDICLANGANLQKDVNQDGANALLLAISNDKNLTLTNYFVSKGLDIKSKDKEGNNAFSYAARAGNIDMLKTLLGKGVPAQDNAFLMAAQGTRRGSNPIEVYTYLESLKLNPKAQNTSGENVLHILARKPKQDEIINHFLAKGIDPNQADEEGNTPFMNAAASNRDLSAFNILLPGIKNINHKNSQGATALALAVNGNSSEVVSLLLDKGADLNTTDGNGDNLGFYLVQSYNARNAADFDAKLKLLKDKGLNLSKPQTNGNTLYHLAISKDDMDLVKKLEPLKIDVNTKSKEGLTALHKAAMISKDDILLKYLLSLGAKKEIVTNFDETVYDLASENESLTKNNINVNFLK